MSQRNIREFLRRFDDAVVSRESLLQAQRARGGLTKELSTSQKKRLKKRLRAKSKKDKKSKTEKPDQIQKSPLEVEIEAEEKRAKIKQEQRQLQQQDRFLQLEDFKQQREIYKAQLDIQQRERVRLDAFATANNRQVADQQIAQFNQAQENVRANQLNARLLGDRQEHARLEDRRIDLQVDEMNARQIENRAQRGVEHRRINADTDRYNADVRRAEIQRDADIRRGEIELEGVRERVARDDAFRHAQLQENQRLALEQLAEQRRDNTSRVELERNRIANQRAVDAERAITDREKEQTLQAGLELLRHRQVPPDLPTGAGLVEEARESSGSSSDASVPDIAETLRGLDRSLAEVDEAGELRLEEDSSSLSSITQAIRRSPPVVQRTAAIQAGREIPRAVSPRAQREGTATPTRRRRSSTPPRGVPISRTRVESALERVGAGTPTPSEEQAIDEFFVQNIASGSEVDPSPEAATPLVSAARAAVRRRSQSPDRDRPIEEPAGLGGQALGAVGAGISGAARLAGGAVAGIGQGVFEQLPAASDVGAAVGRGGVRAVSGVAGAIYEGLAGGEAEDEPTPRIGGGG